MKRLSHLRRLLLASVAALIFSAALPLASTAQMDDDGGGAFKIGPRITLDVGDISDFYNGNLAIGADARYKPADFPVGGSAAFDFYFADDNASVFTLDLNALYPIETEASLSPYVGAGIGYTSVSVDTDTQFGSFSVGGSDTGINLVGGAEFDVGQLRPFAQAQVTLGSLTRIGITGGLLFSL